MAFGDGSHTHVSRAWVLLLLPERRSFHLLHSSVQVHSQCTAPTVISFIKLSWRVCLGQKVRKYHGSDSKAGFREKEKLGQRQTKYMFLTLQWQKSEVSTKGQWKIWYVKSCILFRMLSSNYLLFFFPSLLWTATEGNKLTSKRSSFQPSHFTLMLLCIPLFSMYLLALTKVYVYHT